MDVRQWCDINMLSKDTYCVNIGLYYVVLESWSLFFLGSLINLVVLGVEVFYFSVRDTFIKLTRYT